MARTHPTSKRKDAAGPTRNLGLIVFGLVFFLMGGLFFYLDSVRPLMQIHATRSWVPLDCSILSSAVRSDRRDGENTYSVAITYHYEYAGRTYKSNRYSLSSASSSREATQRVLDDYPAKTTRTCYVNPDEPAESVISRTTPDTFLFWLVLLLRGLLPLLFMYVGWRVMAVGYSGREGGEALAAHANPVAWLPAAEAQRAGGQVLLRPQRSAKNTLGGISILAVILIWWASTSVQARMGDGDIGSQSWVMLLFTSLLVLAALWTIGWVVYRILARFNPAIELSLDRAVLHPGDTLALHWRIKGAFRRLDRLRITLVGQEEAIDRSSDSDITDTEVFCRLVLHDSRRIEQRGSCALSVPPDTMHSFQARSNKIVWMLSVHGDVRRWPDLMAESPIVIAPPSAPVERDHG